MANINIHSEVTGSVWKLLRKPGEQVSEGDEIMLIESMKMEIPVVSEETGTIVEVLVAEGDSVQEGQVVVTIALG